MHRETTTAIQRVATALYSIPTVFVRTPQHPDGGWIVLQDPEQAPYAFALAAAALASGRQLVITYRSFSAEGRGRFFEDVGAVELA